MPPARHQLAAAPDPFTRSPLGATQEQDHDTGRLPDSERLRVRDQRRRDRPRSQRASCALPPPPPSRSARYIPHLTPTS